MKTLDEKIAVMTAYKNGERIEYSRDEGVSWEWAPSPGWNWFTCDYRIAEPVVRKPFSVWLIGGESGSGWRFARSAIELAHSVEFREVLPTNQNACDLMVRVEGNGVQRIVMPMFLRQEDLNKTHRFVKVPS